MSERGVNVYLSISLTRGDRNLLSPWAPITRGRAFIGSVHVVQWKREVHGLGALPAGSAELQLLSWLSPKHLKLSRKTIATAADTGLCGQNNA